MTNSNNHKDSCFTNWIGNPKRRMVVIFAFVVVGIIYYHMLGRWGTVNPIFGFYYTRPFHGRVLEDPPAKWKPSVRVVVSLSTLPHHQEFIAPTLQSLLDQTLPPDAIYLNLPYVNKRLNKPYANFTLPIKGITVNRCEDYGPLTKLIPTLEKETDPDTIIITLDDDQVYEPTLVRHLAWYAENFPNTAFSPCGWSIMPVFGKLGVVAVYIPGFLRSAHGNEVDVLQACCGNTYRRKFFDPVELANVPPGCKTTDDIWVSGYLSTKHGISKVVIPNPEDKTHPEWRKNEQGVENRLSSINREQNGDLLCLTDLEKQQGKWRTVGERRRVIQ